MDTVQQKLSIEAILERFKEAAIAGGRAADFHYRHGNAADADAAVLQVVRNILGSAFPKIPIVTENDRQSHGLFPHFFAVNPLSGTMCFANDSPDYGIAIAYIENGVTQTGIIRQPFHGETFYATRGEGARSHAREFKIANRYSAGPMILSIPLNQPAELESTVAVIRNLSKAGLIGNSRNIGAAVANSIELLQGRSHALYMHKGDIWDLAAESLIIQESGGVAIDLSVTVPRHSSLLDHVCQQRDISWSCLSKQVLLAGSKEIACKLLGVLMDI